MNGIHKRALLPVMAVAVLTGLGACTHELSAQDRQLLDQSRNVKAAYGYMAYGSSNGALTRTASGFAGSTNAYQYTGKRFDSGSNTLDMGTRRYSASTGRFLQQDSYYGALSNVGLSSDALTGNRYALAGANPINSVALIARHVSTK